VPERPSRSIALVAIDLLPELARYAVWGAVGGSLVVVALVATDPKLRPPERPDVAKGWDESGR
jgi:hypothetical protein